MSKVRFYNYTKLIIKKNHALSLCDCSVIAFEFCESIQCRGHEMSWFGDIGHVRGHLNSWISNYMHY